MPEIKKTSDRLYNYIKREHAFFSGLDWFFKNGHPEGVYRWIIDHGYSVGYAEAESEHCLWNYYFS